MEAFTSAIFRPRRGVLAYIRIARPWWFEHDRIERLDSHRVRFYGWESEIAMFRAMNGEPDRVSGPAIKGR